METIHVCSICGFADNQEDIVQDEFGNWSHYECAKDAEDGEHRREKEEFDEQGDPDR